MKTNLGSKTAKQFQILAQDIRLWITNIKPVTKFKQHFL